MIKFCSFCGKIKQINVSLICANCLGDTIGVSRSSVSVTGMAFPFDD